MSYIGLVPSENSSGETRRLRCHHQDRLAARPPAARRGQRGTTARPPTRGITLQRRQDGQPDTCDRDQLVKPSNGCTASGRRLAEDRGKRRTIVAVAVARELAGFCWALAHAD